MSLSYLDKIIREQLLELTGHKNAATTQTVNKSGPGGGRSRGMFAKSYPLGGMIKDPDERPELQDEAFSDKLREDSRGSIVKLLKLPRSIADDLNEINPKIAFALAKIFKIKHVSNNMSEEDIEIVYEHWSDDDGDEGGKRYIEMLELNPSVAKKINNANDEKTIDQIFTNISLDKKRSKAIRDEIFMQFPDGFYWSNLSSVSGFDACSLEGGLMQHCGQVQSKGEMFSLRDQNDSPHVTMTWDEKTKLVTEIAGKQSKDPDKKYWKYINAFLKKTQSSIENSTNEVSIGPQLTEPIHDADPEDPLLMTRTGEIDPRIKIAKNPRLKEGKSTSDLKSWLKEAIPVVVFQLMVCSRAVKVCSGISPAFAKAANESGFEAYVKRIPGHVVNIVVTDDANYEIDMSAIQFEVDKVRKKFDDNEDDPFGIERATIELLKKVSANPYAAVSIKRIDSIDKSSLEKPSGEEWFDYKKTKSFIEKLKKNDKLAMNYIEKIFMSDPDPDVLDFLKEHAEPDVEVEKLDGYAEQMGCGVEDLGYNEEGFKLDDRYTFQDIPISIEQSKGSSREWTDSDGKTGKTKMQHDYGYVEETEGTDDDPVDVYIGDDEDAEWVYVVHQMTKPDFIEHDEDKCMLGFGCADEAKAAYLKHYDDEGFFGGMSQMPVDQFKQKLAEPGGKITNEAAAVVGKQQLGKAFSKLNDSEIKEAKSFMSRYGQKTLIGMLNEVVMWVWGKEAIKEAGKKTTVENVKFLYQNPQARKEIFTTTSLPPLYRGLVLKKRIGNGEGSVLALPTVGAFSSWTTQPHAALRFANIANAYGVDRNEEGIGYILELKDKPDILISGPKHTVSWFDNLINYYTRRLSTDYRDEEQEYIVINHGSNNVKIIVEEDMEKLHRSGNNKGDWYDKRNDRGTLPKEFTESKKADTLRPECYTISTMGKGIPHIGNLKEEKFWEFIEAWRAGNAEITEKLDGSAFMEFGVKEGTLWTKSKNYGPVMDSRDWPNSRAISSLQRAHEALESQAEAIISNWPAGALSVTCEILDGPVPNVLEYGPNAIVLHNTSEEFKRLTEAVKLDGWMFECVPVGKFMLPVVKERHVIEEHLMTHVAMIFPHFGGKIVEGIVIRNTLTNEMVKVVNRHLFTELNKTMWRHREQLGKGLKEDGVWTPGLTKEFRNKVAEHVIGSKTLKIPAIVGYMKRHYGNLSLGEALSKFCNDNKLFSEGYKERYLETANATIYRFSKLAEAWKTQPLPVFESHIYKIAMHPIIVERTDNEFFSVDTWIREEVMTEDFSPLNMIRTALGRVRWFKLCEAFGEMKKDSINSLVEKLTEALGDELFGPPDEPSAVGRRKGDKLGAKADDEPGSKPLDDPETGLVGLDPSNPADAKKILERNADLLKTKKLIDVSTAKELGKGTQGTAFDVGGRKVLKVTKDSKEAIASNKIKGMTMKHVAAIIDVFRFKDLQAYGIIQEKLEPLSKEESDKFDNMLVFTGLPIWLKRAKTWEEAVKESIRHAVKKKGGGDPASKEGRIAKNWATEILDKLENEYKVKSSWEELKGKGISFSDYRGENLMKRGGEYVLIDIGLSDVQGGEEPDVLESIIREQVYSIFLEAGSDQTANEADTVGMIDEDSRGNITRLLKFPKWAADHFYEIDKKHTFALATAFKLYGEKWDDDFVESLTIDDQLPPNIQRFKLGKRKDRVDEFMEDFGSNLLSTLKKKPHLAKKIQAAKDFNTIETIADDASAERDKSNAIIEFPDGFYWTDLKKSSCPHEAEKMGHCGEDERGNLISLRDPSNKPHVTMTWNEANKTVLQIKGKENRAPDQKYWKYVKEFFNKTKSELNDEELLRSKENEKFVGFITGGDSRSAVKIDGGYEWRNTGHDPDMLAKRADLWVLHKGDNPVLKNRGAMVTITPDMKEVHNISDLESGGLSHIHWNALVDFFRKAAPNAKILSHDFEDWDADNDDFGSRGAANWVKEYVPGVQVSESMNTVDNIVSEVVKSMFEEPNYNPADTIGVTIGRFQPFHKGHAAIIRDLASKFTKVVVIVAGNKRDKKNPWSYETRVEMMQRSLPDVMPKVEVYVAEWEGKASGYIPGVLSDIINDHNSSIEPEIAINVLVGPDRFESMKKQMQHAAANRENLPNFDPALVNVTKLPGVKNDMDDMERISSTAIRDALAKNDRNTVEKMLDAHVISDPQGFDNIYDDMREEMKDVISIQEAITEAEVEKSPDLESVGIDNLEKIVIVNADKLKERTGINASSLGYLGHGAMGIAFDAGGGKVLKVTTDAREAVTSNSLKGKTALQHVVKIFDVFRFPGEEPLIYGIVTEKLTELSATEKRDVDRATDFMGEHDDLIEIVATKSWEEFENALYEKYKEEAAKELGVDPNDPKGANKIRKATTRQYGFNINLLKKYNIPEMHAELRQHNIEFADYHSGNVMKRGSHYIINDLGKSNSPGAEPDVLEHASRKLAERFIAELGAPPGTSMSMSGMGHYAAGRGAQSSPWSTAQFNRVNNKEIPPEDEEEK